MVRRPRLRPSLVTKVYLYAFVLLACVFVLGVAANRLLVDHWRSQGRNEAITQARLEQVSTIAEETAAALQDGRPSSARLAQLEKLLLARIRFVPWEERGDYPQALRQERLTVERKGAGGRRAIYWARVEQNGHPVGAVSAHFGGLGRPGLAPGVPAPWRLVGPLPAKGPNELTWSLTVGLVWALLLVLFVIPPLILWVLRPLETMVAVANRLGRGDLASPVLVTRRDEFGDLEAAFEGLRQRIQAMLAQREQLLMDISHEMRAPLTRLAVALPMARAQGAPEDLSEDMQRDIEAMDDLLGELLAFARGRAPESHANEPLDLAELAARVLDDRRLLLESRRLSLETELASAPALGDARLIARALGNLVDNAIKYTPEGGALSVSTLETADGASFRLLDSGVGIPEAELPFVFEPFYRPDRSRTRASGGVGLGLAIVAAIAESHQGQVRLSNRPGGGTCAQLDLPSRQA